MIKLVYLSLFGYTHTYLEETKHFVHLCSCVYVFVFLHERAKPQVIGTNQRSDAEHTNAVLFESVHLNEPYRAGYF